MKYLAGLASEGRSVGLDDLIGQLPYSTSFAEEAIREARAELFNTTCIVVALYNVDYDPAVTGIAESKYLRFVGAFPYERCD